MIAALEVESRGVYAGLPDVDLWDRDRAARTDAGLWPVVAHPPGARWGRSWGGTRPSSRGSSWETTRDASPRTWTRCDGTAVSWSPQRPALRGPAFGLLTPPRAGGWVVADWQGGLDVLRGTRTLLGTAPARPHDGCTQWAVSCLAPVGEGRRGRQDRGGAHLLNTAESEYSRKIEY